MILKYCSDNKPFEELKFIDNLCILKKIKNYLNYLNFFKLYLKIRDDISKSDRFFVKFNQFSKSHL